MKKTTIAILSLIILSVSSCTTNDGAPVSLFLNMDKTSISSDNQVKPKLSGSSCSYSIWPWATIGDSSVNSAKDNAEISKISTLDKSYFSIFTWSPAGWFVRTCTVVTGE